MSKIRESLDFAFEHCFTCKRCRYDLTKREHFCEKDKRVISNPHTMVCDDWNNS